MIRPSSIPSDGHTQQKRSAVLGLLLVATMPCIGVFFAIVWPPTAGSPIGQGIFALAKVWILAIPAVWLLQRRTHGDGLKPHARGLAVGLLSGLVIAIGIVGAYLLFAHSMVPKEQMQESVQRIGLGKPAAFIGFALYTTFINAWLEEYVWRWFVFRQCERLMGPVAAILLSATLFTAHHTLAMAVQTSWQVTTLISIGVFTGGCVWSWLYLRYRSIWPGYVSHVLADLAVFAVGWVILFPTAQ